MGEFSGRSGGRKDKPLTSELAAEEERRSAAPASLSDVFGVMVKKTGSVEKVTSTWQVYHTWYTVNGDVERAATSGVYVAPPRRGQERPTLVVYVDSRTRVVDFMANREIYLVRLANAGLLFSEIVFKLNRRPAKDRAPRASDKPQPAPLPELTPADAAEAHDLLARLSPEVSPALRETVQRAMNLSFRRNRTQ